VAEYRENLDALSWLTWKADDSAVAGIDKTALDTLEQRFGKDMVPDIVEERLRTAEGVDFATATDDQIFDATNEIAQQDVGVSEQDSTVSGQLVLPSDEEMIQEIVRGIFDDTEFRAALDGQWQHVDIPKDQVDQVVEEIVGMVRDGLWDGLVEAMQESADSERIDSPDDTQLDEAVRDISGG